MATKKKAAAPEAPPEAPAALCVNCGAPARWRTVGTGFVAVEYCDGCALRAYPGLGPQLGAL